MKITDIFPDAEVLVALEPEELGVRLLPFLATFRGTDLHLDNVLHHIVGHPQAPAGTLLSVNHYGTSRTAAVTEAVREAWAWLIGAALLIPAPNYAHSIMMFSRRARSLATEADPRMMLAGRRLSRDALHPSIREEVWSQYHRGHYETAVFVAMRAVEIAVREASGLSADLGTNLMRKAFGASGPLSDPSMPEAEREARAHLFSGAIGSYKNPHSHRNVALDDPDEAAEIIMLATHLLRIVDSRAAVRAS